MKVVVLLGTLDTKGAEFSFVRDCVRAQGLMPLIVDVGILGSPAITPDIDSSVVASQADTSLDILRRAADRGAAINAMALGASRLAVQLHAEGRLHGIIAMGGSGNASIAAAAMQALPIGLPKLLVTTLAAGDTRPYVGISDVTLMASVVDIAGLNRLSIRILSNAAAAICGMVQMEQPQPTSTLPLVATTMFGVTTPGVTVARQHLEDLGYEVLVFHATGTGGRALEALTTGGFISGVLDITTTELADELVGGVLSAGPTRLDAAGRLGLPQVVSLGALDMVNFGPLDTVPDRFRARHLYAHTAAVTLMRTTPEENHALGEILARKLNSALGPVAVFVPLRGLSALDVPGQPFYDPDADAALFQSLRANLGAQIKRIEMDTDVNDPIFATAMAATLHDLYHDVPTHAISGAQ